MLEQVLSYISSVDTIYVYLVLFFFSFIENVFPPSPSDVVVVVGASLIASTEISFLPILFITSIGSAMGFVLMYYVGKLFGEKLVRKGKIKFIHKDDIEKADKWFNKWGYKLILANRFLPGTRSVISFFSGVHELKIGTTFLYAAISAFAWNAVIIYIGMLVGNNVELIDYYLNTYSYAIGGLTIVIFAGILIRIFWRKKKSHEIK
ncbi:MAG: DedA family protein [Melioribacteraceae bacterium]|nr:DedA family protein [Melioribacteraceae bacterium]RJP59007.1 MAG: DedA family protein [Ignavibacteriales bacterium]WKZ68684.1 MAG: DedA family protein [Melioribacteraceae bacterium]